MSEQDKSPWRPIETAPKDGTYIVGFDPDNDEVARLWWSSDKWTPSDRWTYPNWNPTLWVPMPEPPIPYGLTEEGIKANLDATLEAFRLETGRDPIEYLNELSANAEPDTRTPEQIEEDEINFIMYGGLTPEEYEARYPDGEG